MAVLVPECGYHSQRLPARYSWYLIFFGDIDVASASCKTNLVPHVGYCLRGLPERLSCCLFLLFGDIDNA